MRLHCISSSSQGNCYLLQSAGGGTLLVELGVKTSEIKQALRFDISGVVGAVVTHEHKDHAKSLHAAMQMGIHVLAPREAFATAAEHPFAIIAEPRKSYLLGEFKVTALQAYHDVNCLAYIIEHEEMGKMLFATDTFKLPYKVRNLNHLLVECNYVDEVLQRNMDSGICPHSLRDRLMLTHMELKTTCRVVEQNMCESLQDVILLHLSNDNADGEMIKQAIEGLGVPCNVATAGLEIEFNKNPY